MINVGNSQILPEINKNYQGLIADVSKLLVSSFSAVNVKIKRIVNLRVHISPDLVKLF